ncbi:hypothetical protein SG34_022480 [Thalassomonas viridans]|uniref:Uncharacterized protein n=1 Tax=Thalassomonas viridans TaxID=137584 RepID=A0AAE9Z137_9GAMM|nr:hypothetical protein [Thalassomonas viridans]WDE04099.1 hypothetical protein SG34_022480 [Thalassomonas viridans]
MNRDNVNVVHLCGALLIVYLIEFILFEFFIVTESKTLGPMWVNAIIFATHLFIDLLLFFLLIFRAGFTRAILQAQGKPFDHIYKYNAELALISLITVFMVFDLLALVENFLRHLSYFGLSGAIVDFCSGLNWVFYQYKTIKFVLLGLTFLLVWLMATGYGQSEYQDPDTV